MPEGDDPAKISALFMNSAEFRADIDGFDPDTIVDMTATLLTPSAGSPLL